MSQYEILNIDDIELDKSNPRIAQYLEQYGEESLDSNKMALLLDTTAGSCASLRESIFQNGGIVHPIIVNHRADGSYLVIEGNTRLQIYRDFRKKGRPGDWSRIKAIVYEQIEEEQIHAIRLQAHLVGPREWEAYSKAKYVYYLSKEQKLDMNSIIAYCGGVAKASEIKHMIAAYEDMQNYYRPVCESDSDFDPKKFNGFVELQSRNIKEALHENGYDESDFSKWMNDNRFSRLEDVRVLPQILRSKKAKEVFLKSDSKAAKKVLAVEEISPDSLKDVPYDLLAKELVKRMNDFPASEVVYLSTDAEYEKKLDLLKDVVESVQLVIDMVGKYSK